MAEQQAAATEAATTETADEQAGTESAVELRDALVAKLKEGGFSKDADGKPVKPEATKPAKPKRGESSKPGDKPEPGADDADAADTPEIAKLKAERRGFAKHKRKWEAQASARESQLQQVEQRAQRLIADFEKDPVAWLKTNKVDVRATLLRQANEDTEDPRDKKIRELDEQQKADKVEREREKAEKDERESKAKQAEAVRAIQGELSTAWGKSEVDDYPTLAALLEPEHIAQRGAEIMIEHWCAHRKELAPSEVFSTMEKELAPLKGKIANGQKKPEAPGAGPGSKRQTREAASPEAPTKRERPSEDVTRRVTREQSVGRPQNFDKYSLRERLVAKARDAMR